MGSGQRTYRVLLDSLLSLGLIILRNVPQKLTKGNFKAVKVSTKKGRCTLQTDSSNNVQCFLSQWLPPHEAYFRVAVATRPTHIGISSWLSVKLSKHKFVPILPTWN